MIMIPASMSASSAASGSCRRHRECHRRHRVADSEVTTRTASAVTRSYAPAFKLPPVERDSHMMVTVTITDDS
jgi:hypothetical protein